MTHVRVERDPLHLTEEDLLAVCAAIESEGWTSEVVEQELLRKGPFEVFFHVLDFVASDENYERIERMARYLTTLITQRQVLRGESAQRTIRGTRWQDENGAVLWPTEPGDRSK